jgi:sterol-4alpha-carboxylate 3-dehydrogenase (decarboxylating)
MDEKTPYITKETSPNHYGWTKVQAEQKVVAANGKSGLRTAALRPCSGVIGPDDAFLIEKSLTERQSTFIFTKPAIDYIFVDNLVYAHLLLEQKLRNNDSKVQGEIFCVSNNEPESLEQMTYLLQSVMEKKKLQPPLAVTYAPQGVLVVLAYMVEQAQYWTGNKIKGDLAFLTPAMFAIASLTYSFDCKKAEEILGYKPLYNMDEALQMTVDQWVEKQRILAEYWEKKDGGEKETKKKK